MFLKKYKIQFVTHCVWSFILSVDRVKCTPLYPLPTTGTVITTFWYGLPPCFSCGKPLY